MIQNRITDLFQRKKKGILSVFFTAGYPSLTDCPRIIRSLEEAGADLLEIGMPFSDPVADGETIQASNKVALDNGMSVELLFEQIKDIRETVKIPLLLMGYINPVLQYGIEAFCEKCKALGIDGLIIPDLPLDLYLRDYKSLFEEHNLSNILLVTPQTSEARIREIDANTRGFIYMVSSNSITGKTSGISESQETYFERINQMNLQNPKLIGFGINNKASFDAACEHASGAIIGSAFIRAVSKEGDLEKNVHQFVDQLKNA